MLGRQHPLGLSWGSVKAPTLEVLVRAAAAGGFAAVSVRPELFFDAQRRGLRTHDFRRLLSDHGVTVASIDPLLSALAGQPQPEDIAPHHRVLFSYDEDACYRAAETLEAESVNLAHFLGRSVEFDHFVDVLGDVAERGRVRGVRLTLEFFPESPVITDLAAALAVVAAVNADNLGIMLDTVHFARSGGDLATLASAPARAIGGFQLADYPAREPGAAYVPMAGRLLPGEGTLPLMQVVTEVLTLRPDLRIDVEVFNEELQGLAPDDAAVRVEAATRQLLERGVAARAPASER